MSTSLIILIIIFSLFTIVYIYLYVQKREILDSITPFFSKLQVFIILFSIAYFLLIEWPKFQSDKEQQIEQRRLYYLQLLSDDNTPNRLKQESFTILLKDYHETNYAGISLINSKESYKTPFSFIECFRSFSSLVINCDTIVWLEYNTKLKRNTKFIDLTNFNFGNSQLQHADFSETSQIRLENQDNWMVIDDEFGKVDYTFIMKYFTDTNLSFSDLEGTIIIDGYIQNVKLKGASFYNVNLKNTGFYNCDLSDADFTGANLDSVAFYQTKISDKTKFMAVQNYETIRIATPMIIDRIRNTQRLDGKRLDWEFDWTKIGDLPDKHFSEKWTL